MQNMMNSEQLERKRAKPKWQNSDKEAPVRIYRTAHKLPKTPEEMKGIYATSYSEEKEKESRTEKWGNECPRIDRATRI
jgi:hypothetical protein